MEKLAMKSSPLKRLLLCICVLSLSVVVLAPRPAYASPGIWDWIKKGLKIAAIVRGDEDDSQWDMDWWITGASVATLNVGYRAVTGCDHDTLMECAANTKEVGGKEVPDPFPDPHPHVDGDPSTDEDKCDPCRPTDPEGETAFMGGGAFGYASAAIQGMSEITPPFSLALYAKDMKQNSFLGGETYAQPSVDDAEAWIVGGIGTYYQDIFAEATYAFWKQTRNLAYLFFVLVLVVMGFMVMLRYQVSPRVTVTITSALPRIALGLILITFSYPIVSVAVDLILPLTIIAKNLIVEVWAEMAGSIAGIINPWEYSALVANILAGVTAIVHRRINLFSVVFLLLILIIILITVVLAFFQFLKRFIGLIKAGILGPIIIAWGTLPGNEDAITGWFKEILANVLALPAIILVMGAGLLILTVNRAAPDTLPLPFAFYTDLVAQSATFLIGLAVLWQAHKVPGLIDKAFSGGNRR